MDRGRAGQAGMSEGGGHCKHLATRVLLQESDGAARVGGGEGGRG